MPAHLVREIYKSLVAIDSGFIINAMYGAIILIPIISSNDENKNNPINKAACFFESPRRNKNLEK